MSLLTLPERFARRVLMDFGFGSLVDKFEEHIGRAATSVLLWLAAMSAFTICLKTIIADGIIPLVELLRGIASRPQRFSAAELSLMFVVGLISGTATVVTMNIAIKRAVARALQRDAEPDAGDSQDSA
jgi:hypothetical protein